MNTISGVFIASHAHIGEGKVARAASSTVSSHSCRAEQTNNTGGQRSEDD